jgi:tetratricopeptide (TPR) repeat protein
LKARPAGWWLGACGLLVATGAVFFWWRAGELQGALAAAIPRRPDLSARPEELRDRIATCERFARNGPARAAALGELGGLYHANGFYPEASQCYQALLQADARNPRWPHLLASILAGYGETDQALPPERRTLKLAPDYVPARLRLGDLLLKTNQPTAAAEAYAAVLARDPDNAYALLGLGRCDIENGSWTAARQHLQQIAVAHPDFQAALNLLVQVCEHLGDTAAAAAARQQPRILPDDMQMVVNQYVQKFGRLPW